MTTIRAAAVQLRPELYSRDGTIERVVAKIDELATRGVQFATFPETVVPNYPYFSFVQPPHQMLPEQIRLMQEAVTVPSPATQAIADAASRAGSRPELLSLLIDHTPSAYIHRRFPGSSIVPGPEESTMLLTDPVTMSVDGGVV